MARYFGGWYFWCGKCGRDIGPFESDKAADKAENTHKNPHK